MDVKTINLSGHLLFHFPLFYNVFAHDSKTQFSTYSRDPNAGPNQIFYLFSCVSVAPQGGDSFLENMP